MGLLQKRQEWQRLLCSERRVQERVAILSTFTANSLEPYLGLALDRAGLPAEIWTGPYNQIAQQCLVEGSETVRFEPTVLLAWARLEDLWHGRALPLFEEANSFTADLLELADVCVEAAQRWRATLLFILPAIPEERPLGLGDANTSTGVVAIATAVREALRQRLTGKPGVLLLDLEEVIRALGSAAAYNQRMLVIAHIPFAEELFQGLGERLTRLLLLGRKPAKKVLVLDADNTLWGGVVGEQGALGIDLAANSPGAAYIAFQVFLLEVQRTGVLLTLCSKNDEADVWEVFARPEMRLKPEMLSAWRIGWQPKSVSIQEIADDLKLGVESFVFIDDSAAELAEVQAAFPEITCIRMPEDPAGWLEALQSSGVLDRLPPVAEDLKRASHYRQERQRHAVERAAPSPEVYLKDLQIEVALFPPTAADIPRLSQLLARTNQFNLNCRRRSALEVSQLCSRQDYLLRLVQVRDRFGDYGVIGAWIARLVPEALELDTFVLSCRALGRGIEEAMLADLFAVAAKHARTELVAAVEICPRNQPAREFFAWFGCEKAGVSSALRCPQWPSYVRLQGTQGLS